MRRSRKGKVYWKTQVTKYKAPQKKTKKTGPNVTSWLEERTGYGQDPMPTLHVRLTNHTSSTSSRPNILVLSPPFAPPSQWTSCIITAIQMYANRNVKTVTFWLTYQKVLLTNIKSVLFTKISLVTYLYKFFVILDFTIPELETCVGPVLANRHEVTLFLIFILSSLQNSKQSENYL